MTTTTLLHTAIAIGPEGPELEIPDGTPPGTTALAIVAFDSFVTGIEPLDIPRAGRGEDESLVGLRFRFLVEDDGAAFVGGRIA